MNLSNVELLTLQSSHMQKDPTTQAMCTALQPQFRQLAVEVQAALIYARVDHLDSDVLDELAWQLNIDWYDSKATVEVKRLTIKNALYIHRTRGTPAAVERIVSIFFDGDATVEEWFDYAGVPFYFRVVTSGAIPSQEKLDQFFAQVEKAKRLSTRLESVTISRINPVISYTGLLITTKDSIELSTEVL